MEGLGFGLGAEFAIAARGSGKPAAARRAGLVSARAIGQRPGLFCDRGPQPGLTREM
jgi:hypothetical protein